LTVLASFDPGLSGAAAMIRCGAPAVYMSVIDIPIMDDNSKTQVNVDRLCQWIELHRPDEAIIENVVPRGGAGGDAGYTMNGAAAFRFGMACGQIRAVVQCYRIPLKLVVPRVWKAHFSLKGKSKKEAIAIATSRLPAAAPFLTRGLDHNRAEAILLALYESDRRGFI
jgi:hypothetical protein